MGTLRRFSSLLNLFFRRHCEADRECVSNVINHRGKRFEEQVLTMIKEMVVVEELEKGWWEN